MPESAIHLDFLDQPHLVGVDRTGNHPRKKALPRDELGASRVEDTLLGV